MLSEEEKQAIKNLKEITELAKEEIKNNNKNASAVLDIIDLKSLNTVLNLITKLQKENKEKDKQIDLIVDENVEKTLKLIEDSINKKCNGLECNVVKNNIDLRLENIQLNKQIDLMAEYIDEIDLSEYICEEKTSCDENCKACIKQYFETKALK